MAFADRFAQIADPYFASPIPGQLAACTATLAFGLQIFFDFSGYTDMAIGMAKLLGFHFPENPFAPGRPALRRRPRAHLRKLPGFGSPRS
jgi:D-alanyl-lipoteichoic acid acyltransferase DltB (MBOAT superfamily)